jgi:DDE superfamily endonuclease/Helix-turn-helix of DDE superfamily endonuclease
MISYTSLSQRPQDFRQLTGISLEEFEILYQQFVPLWQKSERQRLKRPHRQRVIGGGRAYKLDLPTQLLMTLVWIHLYLTTAALGVLFGVNKSAISRNSRRVLGVLRQIGEQSLWWSEPPTRFKGRTWPEVVAVNPDLLTILDMTEIRIQRPTDPHLQAAHYSGKKKTFTRKAGLIVNEHGQIRGVTCTRPGHVHDLTAFRQSELLGYLPPETTVVGDKGFEGLHRDLPAHSVAIPHKTHFKHPLEEAEKWANRDVASQRMVVENTICELKHFKVLADHFRHTWERLDDAFRAVVALVNIRIARRLADEVLV